MIGLGSGRAVWATIEALEQRLGDAVAALPPCARRFRPSDGADELTADPNLLEGGGGAMLRERLGAT